VRDLVKTKILRMYEKGLDELNISLINYDREMSGKPPIPNQYIFNDKTGIEDLKNPEFDFEKIVEELTDEELLEVFDAQECLRYR